MLTETFLTYGQAEPPAELIPLQAGPLALLYDPTSGMVRRIKLGEVEVLRGIYAAVRDRNWGTVPGAIREIAHVIEPQRFRIEFESVHQQGDIQFVWHGLVRGDAEGTVRYEFAGEAKTTFLRNRIGFCVLHPIRECAWAWAKQFRVDGTKVISRFPDLIEPQIFGQSSFCELRGVTHEIAPNLRAHLELEGDTFEMEDQRNWTDASFKTYCTPLALPFPVEIQRGHQIRQTVTLRLINQQSDETAAHQPIAGSQLHVGSSVKVTNISIPTLIIPETPTGRLPDIGLGVASHGQSLNGSEISTLRQLRLSHLRVDVRLATEDWPAKLERAAHEAIQLNAKLELVIHLPRDGKTDHNVVAKVLERHATALARVLALREGEPATSVATLARVRELLGSIHVPVGCGSDGNFCELNREHAQERAATNQADLLFWPVSPQVHATDHLSIMETLEAQAATVRSARAFAGNLPLIVSPVTLKQRFNPVATDTEFPMIPGELPSQADPRQLSHFAAAWTLGSIAAFSMAGVTSVTYYETTGSRGVLERATGSPLPEKFPSSPGTPFPVFHLLTQLSGFQQMALISDSQAQSIAVMALYAEERPRRVLVANLTGASQASEVAWPAGARTQLQLRPYEVARVDWRP